MDPTPTKNLPLKKRLEWIMSVPCTNEIDNRVVIDDDTYTKLFGTVMNVKTLRTEKPTDKPVMYYYDNNRFRKGAQSLFKEANYKKFNTMMDIRKNAELTHRLQGYYYEDNMYFDNFNPDFLNVQNGILNLRTGKFLNHDPKYRMTTILPVKYDPNAKYDFMTKFVSEVVDGTDQLVIQEMFGDCLYRRYKFQKAIMLTGAGANGKDVVEHCLVKMLGKENVSAVDLLSLVNDRFATADLHHKYANISGETPSGSLVSTDKFKALRGGTPVRAQRKHGQPFTFVNYAKMIFATNKIPKAGDDSFGFWRSWIIVNFPHTFTGKKDNKNLRYELTAPERMSGILNYAIDGLKRLLEKNQYSTSKTVEDIEKEWKKSSDSPLYFITAGLISDDNGEILTNSLLSAYYLFCQNYNLKPETANTFWKSFNKHIKSAHPDAQKKQFTNGKYYWKGISLN